PHPVGRQRGARADGDATARGVLVEHEQRLTREANARPEYNNMLIDAAAADIVYTPLFTGVHGNYLRSSVAAAGLDPDNLPLADKKTMNFGSGGSVEKKVWRDIWSAGQGVGAIDDVPAAAEVVERLADEYRAAYARLGTQADSFLRSLRASGT
ncbi:MAG: NAD(P)H-dependent flavin oxidoreductase, partial [Burkholderiales bacterium]